MPLKTLTPLRGLFTLTLFTAAQIFPSNLAAESSSWFKRADPPAKAQKKSSTQNNKAVHTARREGSPDKSSKSAPGNNAAYQAFDQGKYLTALKLAEEAVANGDPAAHTLIGRIYGEGFGVPVDLAVATKWYTRAAELGDLNAMFALGIIAAEGRGVEKDRNAAAQLFEQAARKGHPEANYNLGLLFLHGEGKPENPHRAAQHIQYAAEQGLAAAQYDLSALYQKGVGVDADAYEASRWISLAAEQGMPAAQYDYAVMLLQGKGLKKHVHKALGYLREAAEKGVAGAQNRLAHIYLEGVGVAKDPIEMTKWRTIAKAGGIKDEALDKRIEGMPEDQRLTGLQLAAQWQDKRLVNPLGP